MAITAVFQASFEQFVAEANKANASLTQIESTSKQVVSALESVAGAFGIGLGIGSIVAFGEEVLSAGEDIRKMSLQMSISTDEVQRFMYIASQTDTPVQTLVNAVQNLQQRLGDETSGAAGAMAKLNINVDTFSKLGAYQQMLTLSSAIKDVHDPLDAASIKFGLFGKAWKEVGPAMLADMEAIGEAAPKMADSTVESLARISDAMKGAKAQATVWGGAVVLAFEEIGFATGNLLSAFNPEHFGTMNTTLLKAAGAINDPDGLKGALNSVKPPLMDVGAGVKDLTLKGFDLKVVTDDLVLSNLKHSQSLKAEAEAAKVAELQFAQLTKVTDEYYKAVNAASHDTLSVRVADAYLSADAEIAAMTKSKNYSIEAEMMIWKAADQTAQNIMQQSLESDKYTKEHYALLADQARIAYDFALDHASSYSNAEIQLFKDAYREAEQTSNHWVASAGKDLDDLAKHSPAAVAAIQAVEEATKKAAKAAEDAAAAYQKMMALGNSVTYDLSTDEGMAQFKKLNPSATMSVGKDYFKTHSLQDAILAGLVDLYAGFKNMFGGSGLPGFASGGPVTQDGPIYAHAGEYVLPKGGGGGGATVTNIFNIVDNTENIARKVSDMITRQMLRGGARIA